MYNRYLPPPRQPPASPAPCPQPQKGPGGLTQLLGLRLQKPDADTWIALAVIWFLLADGDLAQTDLIIIIAVLLLLGL